MARYDIEDWAQAWESGRMAGGEAAASFTGEEWEEWDRAPGILMPDPLSGEWAGDSLPEMFGNVVNVADPDDVEAALDRWETAYLEGWETGVEMMRGNYARAPRNPY
jgi:hypothetical protein